MRPSVIFLLLCVWFAGSSAVGQPNGAPAIDPSRMTIGAVPEWVKVESPPSLAQVAVDTPAEADLEPGDDEEEEEGAEGTMSLVQEQRVDLATSTHFVRTAFAITAPSGLDSAGQVSVDFDPSYQRLVWHHVTVRRDGEPQERLVAERIELTRRYDDLEWSIYDGSYTAFLLLDDLRVGDVIDYAYSVIGFNPVFSDRFADFDILSRSRPIGRIVREYRAPPGRALNWKTWSGAPDPAVENSDDGMVLRWSWDRVPAVVFDYDAPPEWDARARIQVSEFASWAEVVAWAQPLYPAAVLDDGQLASLPPEAGAAYDPVARAEAMLHFVQEEIRYLTVSLGESSHRPSAPHEVVTRRFGDCKDKAYLFCTLLQAAGIRAVPALVNTAWCEGIGDMLPMPHAFDHVIVRVDLPDGRRCWVDPTVEYQGGPLDARHLPRYELALPLAPDVEALQRIPAVAATAGVTEVREEFTLGERHQPATFVVTTVYRGATADSQRAQFAGSSRRELSESFLQYYSTDYPEITATRPYDLRDDRRRNEITLVESYRIPGIWEKPSEANDPHLVHFWPNVVLQELDRPARVARSSPYELAHPRRVSQQTIVHLPSPWPRWASDDDVESPYFVMRTEASLGARLFTYSASYESRARLVPAEDVVQFAHDIDRAQRELGYQISWGDDVLPAIDWAEKWEGMNGLRLVLAPLIALMALVGLAVPALWPRRGPPQLPTGTGPAGFSGWLVVLTIYCGLRVLTGLISFVGAAAGYFVNAKWNTAIETAGAGAAPWRELLLWIEFVAQTAAPVMMLVAVIALAMRRRHARWVTLVALTVSLVASLAWATGSLWIGELTAFSTGRIIGRAIASMVWSLPFMAYLIFSRRVANTLTR